MKFTSFLKAGLLVASCGIVATGCNENPVENPPATVASPVALKANSLGESTVKLAWNAPNDTAITGYQVSYSAVGTVDSSSVTVAAASGVAQTHTVTGLKGSTEYRFYVRTMRGTQTSSAATINWAGASRYVDGGATTLKMYEKDSDFGSGLLLDPVLGGPRMASVASEPANVQLAFFFKPADFQGNPSNAVDSVIIGAAPAFPEYSNRPLFYKDVYVSGSTFFGTGLDDIFPEKPLDQLVLTDTNARAFVIPAAQASGIGQGFFVRIGTGNDMHYARVFVRNVAGNLVQGTGKNQYVQVDVSYQKTAGLPFAKRAVGGGYSRVGYYSRIGAY